MRLDGAHTSRQGKVFASLWTRAFPNGMYSLVGLRCSFTASNRKMTPPLPVNTVVSSLIKLSFLEDLRLWQLYWARRSSTLRQWEQNVRLARSTVSGIGYSRVEGKEKGICYLQGLHCLMLDWSEWQWCGHGRTELWRIGSKVLICNFQRERRRLNANIL